jgi:predicted DNA-binding transcriptional regulator YafY
MARSDADGRLRRMELLAAELKQEGLCTVSDLAQRFGVSERTIARDLRLMREQGLPIEADRGRGGGVRLDHRWGVGRLNLSYPEAVDLLISIAVAEQMQSPMFLANLASVRRQLVASFSREKRRAVESVKSRILIGLTASTFVQAGFTAPPKGIVQAVHQAFLDQNSMRISYRREDGETSQRLIEPHYLMLNYPVWYVVAFDHLRDAPRTFRCDRILSVETLSAQFRLRPRDDFQDHLETNGLFI